MARDVQVSKKLSWLLRHGAVQEKLKLERGGYVNLAEVVRASPPRDVCHYQTMKTFPSMASIN